MAIKSVTTENIAEFVQARQDMGSEIKTPAQVAAEEPKGPIVATGTETVSDAPDPGEQTPTAAKGSDEPPESEDEDKAPKWYRQRLKQLNQEKKDLEEFAREEYESRVALQGKLKAAEVQPPAVVGDGRPDRSKYKPEEADKYEDDLLRWSESRSEARITAKLRLQAQAAAARKEFSDFDEVIQRASGKSIPMHINAAISESDVGAQLAYHLAKYPQVESEILSLPPAAALLRLGEIQTQLKRKAPAEEAAATAAPKIPPVTRAPPPVPALASGPGDVPVDLSKTDFKSYQRIRMEQKAKARRSAH